MTSTPIRASSRVDVACTRLERAIADVEAALDARAPTAEGADTTGLETELAESKARNDALVQATDAVTQRLDGVIGRLKAVLEE